MKMCFRDVSVFFVGLIVALIMPQLSPTLAQTLEIPVMEHATGDLDTCALGQVVGLRAEGDGFLAVRSGPAVEYAEIDQLHNSDKVWIFDQHEEWVGVVFDVEELSCSPIEKDRPVETDGKKGWVHENWIEVIAG